MAKRSSAISSTLRRLLFERNMKPIDLARALNVSQPTIHRLISGKSIRPYHSSLKPIADFFSMSIEQLVNGETSPDKSNQQISAKMHNKYVPLISWKSLSNLEEARKNKLREIIVAPDIGDNAFALILLDTTMEPMFQKGSTLIFDPSRQTFDRCFALIKLLDMNLVVFRQLLLDLNHRYIKLLNPDLRTNNIQLLDEKDEIIACLIESRLNCYSKNEINMIEEA